MLPKVTNWDRFRFDLGFDTAAFRDNLLHIEAYRLVLSRLQLPQELKTGLQKLYSDTPAACQE